MKRLIFILVGVFLLSFVAVLPYSSSASQDAVRLQRPLQHEVSVTLKLIQVYVTDKEGKPVTNLTKSDFRLFDNGEPQTITDFEKHAAPETVARPESTEAKKTAEKAPPAGSLGPTSLPPSRLNRKFFFLIDLDANDLPGIAKSRAAALQFLETQILPTDEVGILSYSHIRGLDVNEYLTTDHAKVREAIQNVGGVPGRAVGGTGNADTGIEGGIWNDNLTKSKAESSWANRRFTNGMSNLAKALRYIPGYKNIILFSSGGLKRKMLIDTGVRRRLEEMSREFATSNAPLFAVNTETPDAFNPSGSMADESLKFIAERSGGKAYKEIGAVTHFAEIAKEIQSLTQNYYVLGYPVRETWDGKFHTIKVEVKTGDYRVQAQPGYFNPKLFSDYTDVEKTLHLVDVALADKPLSQVPARFDMAALPLETEMPNDILFVAAVPVEKLRDMAGKKVEVISLAFNAAEEIVDMKRTEESLIDIREPNAFLLSLLSVPPGFYKCRVVVRNLESGRAAVAAAAAVVPDKVESGIKLLPPLFVKPDRGAFYLKAHGQNAGSYKKGAAANLKNLIPYDVTQYAPYLEKILHRDSEVWALVRCAVLENSAPKLRLTAFLWDKAVQQKIPIRLAVVKEKRGSGMNTFFINMAVPDVEPDEYTLHIVAEDEASGASSEIVCDFTVEDATGLSSGRKRLSYTRALNSSPWRSRSNRGDS